jgi:hypothetical protein
MGLDMSNLRWLRTCTGTAARVGVHVEVTGGYVKIERLESRIESWLNASFFSSIVSRALREVGMITYVWILPKLVPNMVAEVVSSSSFTTFLLHHILPPSYPRRLGHLFFHPVTTNPILLFEFRRARWPLLKVMFDLPENLRHKNHH